MSSPQDLPEQPPIPPFPHTPPSAQTPYWCTECIDYSEHSSDHHKKTVRWKGNTPEGRHLLSIQKERSRYRKNKWAKQMASDPQFWEIGVYGLRAIAGFLRVFS